MRSKKKKISKSILENKSKRITFGNYRNTLTFIIAFILLIIVLKPMVFDDLRPGGVDVIGSMGSSHQRKEFQEETGELVLWNSPVFSGMPIYHRLLGRVFSLDNLIIDFFGKLIYPYVLLYLIGFIGMFYLLRSLSLGYWSSVFGALGFIFIPSYMSLLNIGHFAKFRPIMYMPLVTFFFLSVMKKKNLIWLVGFIFAFSIQIRTEHYQIIFYQILMFLFIGIYYLVQMIRKGEVNQAILKLSLFIGASILIIMMVAQPLFVTSEYTPYSIRGGTGEEGSSGLSTDYATKWSFNPPEMAVWVMPRFFGGTSNEVYTGNKVEQFKDRPIPGYWGEMPFTQSYEYIGIILIFMALMGLILNWKNSFIKMLFGLFALALLLSFGRHFPLIFNLFFRYVPAFNKFRVPAMISVIMQIIIVIWAAYGLESILKAKEENKQKIQRILLIVTIFFFVLGLLPNFISSNLSFMKVGEAAQYNPQAVKLIKLARQDMMQSDGIRLILFSIMVYLSTLLLLKNKLKPLFFSLIILTLVCIDQIPFVKKAEGKLSDPKLTEITHFRKTATDEFLLKDDSYYRIYPITENPFNGNDWSYYHNSIGGYSAAKLRVYQDVIEKGLNPPVPFRWNILKMLNTKYMISKQQLPGNQVQLVFQDKSKGFLVYKMPYQSKPAWFIGEYNVIDDIDERFDILNSTDFDVYKTALLEKDLPVSLDADSATVTLKEQSFNVIKYSAVNKAPALLVVSEIYYPKGWKCFVDGIETEIYKTDHALRSVLIKEAGNHDVVFTFEPHKFNKLSRVSLLGHIFAWIMLVALILRFWILRNKRENN